MIRYLFIRDGDGRALRDHKHVWQALDHADGPFLLRLRHTARGGDPIDELDVSRLLRGYARWCAQRVLHLWDAPDAVKQFLFTGDDEFRHAAHKTLVDDHPPPITSETIRKMSDSDMAARVARDSAVDAVIMWSPEISALFASSAAAHAVSCAGGSKIAEQGVQRRHLTNLVNREFEK